MSGGPPHVWMDLTTTSRSTGINGTTRTELRLAEHLALPLGETLRYCRYSRRALSFAPDASFVPPVQNTPPQRTDAGTPLRALGRSIERGLRFAVQEPARWMLRRGRMRNPDSAFPDSRKGDVLFLAGETWSRRYDLDVITGLKAGGRRIALLCQDVIPISHPHFFGSRELVARFDRYFRFLIREADLIVAISRSTKSEIEKFAAPLGGVRGEIAVVELGSDVAAPAAKKPALPFEVSPEGFVLAVSTVQARKNFDLLYRLWQRFAEEGLGHMPKLMIVGEIGFGTETLVSAIGSDPKVAGRIALLNATSDSELAWLYRNCLFSLYPSHVEGWGLPISESLAFGKLCVASNTYSMPEAGAGFAIHLDPQDFDGWYRKIRELAGNPALVASLNADIAQRYVSTGWTQSASRIATLLRGLLGAH